MTVAERRKGKGGIGLRCRGGFGWLVLRYYQRGRQKKQSLPVPLLPSSPPPPPRWEKRGGFITPSSPPKTALPPPDAFWTFTLLRGCHNVS